MDEIKDELEEEFDEDFDDEELELSDEQAARNDEIYNAAFAFCQVLTENPDLEWDMEYIGAIADFAAAQLARRGMKVRFPSVVTDDEDGTQYIEEYYEV